MKSTRFFLCVAGLVAIAVSAGAQTLNLGASYWGSSNPFYSVSAGLVATTNPADVSWPAPTFHPGTTAFGATIPATNSTVFGLAKEQPTSVASYNLGTPYTSLSAGTSLHLVFTGLSGPPNYVAYTGGPLIGYTYNSGTLTFDTTTVNPVASGSDTTGNTLTSAFGMIIVTGGPNNYGGTVFRSDMYWGDINPLNTSYTGVSPTVGLDVNGQAGALATFNAYMPQSFLTSIGIMEPANSAASVLKADGTHIDLTLSRLFYTPGVVGDPGFPGGGYTFDGVSTFDFDGGGADGFALLTYANSNWSAGNIGISAIPEPGDFALGAGAAALALVYLRRRRRAAA